MKKNRSVCLLFYLKKKKFSPPLLPLSLSLFKERRERGKRAEGPEIL